MTIRKYFLLCLWFYTDINSFLNNLSFSYSMKQLFFLSNWLCRRMLKSQTKLQGDHGTCLQSLHLGGRDRCIPKSLMPVKTSKALSWVCTPSLSYVSFLWAYSSESTSTKVWHTAQKTECWRQPLMWAAISMTLELVLNNKWKNRKDVFACTDVLLFFIWVAPLFFMIIFPMYIKLQSFQCITSGLAQFHF